MALVGLGTLANAQGDTGAALTWLHDGLAMAREVGDRTVTAYALSVLGNQAEDSGAYDAAEGWFGEANRIFTGLDDPVNVAITGYHLGVVAFGQGRLDVSEHRCLESLEISRRMGDSWGTAISLAQLGLVRGHRGEICEAASDLDLALDLFARLHSRERIADTLYRVASIASESGSHEVAVRLFTDATRLREEVGAALSLPERAVYEEAERQARAALRAPPAHDHAAIGASRTLDDVIDDAHRMLMDIADACARRID
jgi:tetratricopeptide (TPR) repeat protein